MSSPLLRFIECNILIKNTHTSPLWCIKRFLAKHSNVAINFPPSTLTSNNSSPSILYLMFILMAAFQKEKGKRGKIYSATLPIAISLMFSIKFSANWETNTWKKKGGKQAHLGKILLDICQGLGSNPGLNYRCPAMGSHYVLLPWHVCTAPRGAVPVLSKARWWDAPKD